MLVLNLKVNSDKLVDDILKEDNSSETIPKDSVYGIAKRNTLKPASNPNTQTKLSEEQEYYLHLYETQHDKIFNKTDNSPQKIKVYTYADEQPETYVEKKTEVFVKEQPDTNVEKQTNTYAEEPIYTYAEEHKLPWYVRLINFIKHLFDKIFKRNKN